LELKSHYRSPLVYRHFLPEGVYAQRRNPHLVSAIRYATQREKPFYVRESASLERKENYLGAYYGFAFGIYHRAAYRTLRPSLREKD
jgi:hypothetical protein